MKSQVIEKYPKIKRVEYKILLDRILPFIIHKKNNRKKRGASVSYYTKSVLEDAEGQLLFCV